MAGSPTRPAACSTTIGKRQTFTPAQNEQRGKDGIAHISKQFVRYGLTTVHHEGGNLSAIQEVRARGELLHRVSYEASGRVLDSMIASGIQTGFGDEWIKFGATSEHTVDGSFSERTMALSQPYPGDKSGYKGNVTETQETLNAWIEKVHRAGIQVNCHANGDVAIDMFLTAVERAQKLFPRADARPKITHCTLINENLVQRIKALDAIPAMFTTYAYYNSDKFVFYGEDLMKRSMAYRSFLDAGVHAAAGSDFSPGPFAPLMGIQGMVTRKGWDGEGLGREPEDHAWRKQSRSTRCTAPTRRRKRRSKAPSRRASLPTSSCCRKTRTRSIPRRSRTSRSCARSSAATQRTKHRTRRIANRQSLIERFAISRFAIID